MRILIGYDETESAMAVMGDLRSAGLPASVDAIVMTVADVLQHPTNTIAAERTALDAATKISSSFPGWTVSSIATIGSPAGEILAAADRIKPDLIIIGQKNHSLEKRNAFLGRTFQAILNEAECSVRVSRGKSVVANPETRIVIGFDGTESSANAVAEVISRNWPSGSQVRLILAVESNVLSSIGRFAPQMVDAAVEAKIVRQWGETLASWSITRLKDAGLPATVVVDQRQPKNMIVELAADWEADTIFVGSHGFANSSNRPQFGSVSMAVAASSSCSVEVVRSQTPYQ